MDRTRRVPTAILPRNVHSLQQQLNTKRGLRSPAEPASPLGLSDMGKPATRRERCTAGGVGQRPRARRGGGAAATTVWAIFAGAVALREGHERAYSVRLLHFVPEALGSP